MSLLFLTKFRIVLLNVDSILPYKEVASDVLSETLTVSSVTSTNSMKKPVTHWTLVSAEWLLTNHTVNFLSCSFSTVLLKCYWRDFIFIFSILLVGLFLVFLVSAVISPALKSFFRNIELIKYKKFYINRQLLYKIILFERKCWFCLLVLVMCLCHCTFCT
jgi:hypothetical protein